MFKIRQRHYRYSHSKPSTEVPLSMLPTGSTGKITRIIGGRCVIRRLSDMGFIPNVEIKVVHNQSNYKSRHGGPLVVEIKDSRIALGRGIGMKIIVKRVDD